METRRYLIPLALALGVLSCRHAKVQDSASVWVAEIGEPQYFAVLVDDVDTSVEWYRNVFGLQDVGGSAAEDGRWRIENLRNERLFVEIIRDDRAQSVDRAQGFFKVGFQVPDLDVVADKVERVTGERPRILDFARFGMRILQLRDPDGNIIQLSSPLVTKD